MHEYLPGSRLLLCANNLLYVSHLNYCHLLLVKTLAHLKVHPFHLRCIQLTEETMMRHVF